MSENKTIKLDENGKLHAVLRCVTEPSEEQRQKFVQFLKNKYELEDTDQVNLEIVQDPDVHGGFILDIGSDEYDWSTRGRERQFENQINDARARAAREKSQEGIMEIMRAAVEQFHL